MNASDHVTPQEAVTSILSAFEVAKIVYVDDAIDSEAPSVEDVIVAAMQLDTTLLLEVFPEFKETDIEDRDVLRKRIQDTWTNLSEAEQQKRDCTLFRKDRETNEVEINDEKYISILSGIVPTEKLVTLSPTQWDKQKDEYVLESQCQKILFLFDRDFSSSGSGGDSDGGIKIIASLLNEDTTGKLICGLLTHTVKPETMLAQWDEISNNHSIPKDRFVVIPKLHLDEDPLLFAQALKFVALSPDFSRLKNKTKDIISEAAMYAADRIQEMDIYDLDRIVFKVAADEGIWEPDMLFRLHSLFHRTESRRLAHEDGILETISSELRKVSGIPTQSNTFPASTNAWQLQQQELYEFSEHINKNFLPIELGDIFERVDGSSPKKYILLAQPCDLMIRSDGKRYPELHRIPLIEVVLSQDGKVPYYSEELPYFGQSPAEKWFVKFKAAHFIRYCILDLCAFNEDGRSQITLDDQVPTRLRPALNNRFEMLSKRWRKAVQKADVLLPANNDGDPVKLAKSQIEDKLRDLLFGEDIFSGKLTKSPEGIRKITCNCKRVARLSKDRAIGLLMSYTANLSRPAYERDFAEGF